MKSVLKKIISEFHSDFILELFERNYDISAELEPEFDSGFSVRQLELFR